MKKNKLSIIIALLLFSTIAQAQITEPIFSKKSSWTVITANSIYGTLKVTTYKIDGDTLIGDQNYSKLYADNNYYCALRETEDNRVYTYFSEDFVYPAGEYLTYDFDWYPGKTLYIQIPNDDSIDSIAYVVLGNSIDSIQLLDGKYYQYINLGNLGDLGPFKLIRGIGDTFFPFRPFELPTNGNRYALLCFYIDDTLVYSNPNFNYCFVAVTEIVNVPATTMVDVPLTLSGTVIPENATYQNIVWSVYDAGTTDVAITNGILNATAEGTVVVTATVSYDVAGTAYTQNFTIEVKPMSLNEPIQEFSNIKIYPNPSSHSITVEFLENLEIDAFKVFDLKGMLIKSLEVRGKDAITIEVQDLAKGAYIYAAILKNNQKLSGKIIIQ